MKRENIIKISMIVSLLALALSTASYVRTMEEKIKLIKNKDSLSLEIEKLKIKTEKIDSIQEDAIQTRDLFELYY